MALPRISIVTPSFNQGKYVEWTVRSVLMQRYPELEYIVMDGGSTDRTHEVLERYADHFSHWVSERDDGQADAVSRGLARSTGEIMSYLNSDDMLAPGALQFVAQFFRQHPQIDAIYSHRVNVIETNKVASYWILPSHCNYLMKRWDHIPQETCFWRRRLFERCGNIDPSLHFALDYDLFLRYMNGGQFFRVNRFLGAFRYHPESKTSRILADVGHREVRQVRAKHGIRIHKGESMIGGLFSLFVQRGGYRYEFTRRPLPGSVAGKGYDYDELWGGLLNDCRLPRTATGAMTSR